MNKYDKLGVAIISVIFGLAIIVMGIGVGASFIFMKIDDIKYDDDKSMVALDIMEIALTVLGILAVICIGAGLIITAVTWNGQGIFN